jgi:DNA-binding NtrC family response regulator
MPLKGASILIVDDEPLVAMNHADLLEDAGCQALRAESLAVAWNLVRARPFDALLLDHDLGDGKGWDLLELMRGASLSIPAVYLSAAVPATLAKAASCPGVSRALAKPVSKELLLEAFEELLAKNSKPKEELYPRLIGDLEREMLFSSLPKPGSGQGGQP